VTVDRIWELLLFAHPGTPRDAVELARHARDEGQGLAEYALILALIAVIAIVALIFLGGSVSKVLSTVGKSI